MDFGMGLDGFVHFGQMVWLSPFRDYIFISYLFPVCEIVALPNFKLADFLIEKQKKRNDKLFFNFWHFYAVELADWCTLKVKIQGIQQNTG
jgi:hypothetical protein